MYNVGCDQHKYYSFVAAKDREGTVMNQEKLYHNDRERIVEYFSSLPKDSAVLLEASGFAPWLADLIQELGVDVKLAHPLRTRAIAEEKIKTDKLSAHVLADLLRANLVSEAYLATPEIRQKRTRMRYRQSLVHMRTMAKNKIHSILAQLGLEPPQTTDLFGKAGRTYLSSLTLASSYQEAVKGYLTLIDTLTPLVRSLDTELRKEIAGDKQLALLVSIPGIGTVLSQLIMAEIGDIARFRSSGKLASYAGMVPSLHQSGTMRHLGPITKRGNKYLRWAFVEAAHVAIRIDPYLGAYYQKMRQKKGAPSAITAVAHKLLTYAYQVLSKNEPYQYKKMIQGRA